MTLFYLIFPVYNLNHSNSFLIKLNLQTLFPVTIIIAFLFLETWESNPIIQLYFINNYFVYYWYIYKLYI